MKKEFLIMALSLALPWLSVQTAEATEVTHLTILQTDGNSTHIQLKEAPVLTIEGSDIAVKSENIDFRVPREQVEKLHFSQIDPSSADAAVADDFNVSFIGKTLTVSGAGVNYLEIYDISGRRLAAFNAAGVISADLSIYPKGVLVVSVAGHPAFKIFNN